MHNSLIHSDIDENGRNSLTYSDIEIYEMVAYSNIDENGYNSLAPTFDEMDTIQNGWLL